MIELQVLSFYRKGTEVLAALMISCDYNIPPSCQLIMVEGINGAGKSTLTNSLKIGSLSRLRQVLDYSNLEIHPVDLQQVARLNHNQYDCFLTLVKNECLSLSYNRDEIFKRIEKCTFEFEGYLWVAYLSALPTKKFVNSIRFAHDCEIYDGGASLEEYRYLQLQRWRQFVHAASNDTISLFEANFFQYPLMEMIGFHLPSDQQIFDYYSEFINIIKPMGFHLFYLEVPNVARAIERAALERVHDRKGWIGRYTYWFDRTAFANKNNLSGVDGIIKFCQERQRIEKLIIDHFKDISCRVLIRDDLI